MASSLEAANHPNTLALNRVRQVRSLSALAWSRRTKTSWIKQTPSPRTHRRTVYPWLLRRRHSGIGRAPRNPIVTLPAGPPPPPVPPRGGRRTFPRRVARLCMCPTGAGCMRLAREGPWDRETDTATIFPATRCSGCIIATGPGVHPPCECDCAGCMAGGLRSWRLRQAACEAEEDAAFLAARRSSQAAGPSAGTPLLPGSGSAASGSGDS